MNRTILDAVEFGYNKALEQMNEPAQKESWGERHEAYRYKQIDSAVSGMGGWANFSHWVKRHAKEYFKSLGNLEIENQRLRDENTKLREKSIQLDKEYPIRQ